MKFYGIGTIGKDIELKTTQSQIPFCSFNIACTRKFKDASGEKVTDWFTCTAWRKTAELIAQYFAKGDKIMVEGDLQVRTYDDANGKKVFVTDLIVESFEFCNGKAKEQSAPKPTTSEGFYPEIGDDNEPFDL